MLQIVCEVCALPQPPATRCARCDLPLKLPPGVSPVADPPIQRLPGLEPTIGDPVLLLEEDQVPGFEPTSQPPVGELPREFVPGFEATEQLLIDLPGEDPVLPGIERTTEDFERTAPASAVNPLRCPWCGYQAEGRVCGHCGRAKSRVLPGAAAAQSELFEGYVRCRACAATVPAAMLCSDCGQPLPVIEE